MKLTDRQEQAQALIAKPATHVMLFGGSRSGKTFLLVRAVIVRALAAPDSRHAILRFRFIHVKASIIADTWRKVLSLCFPGVEAPIDKRDWYAQFPNGSQVWFGGLDDKERTEKILGMEFATLYLNEASQIPKSSRDIAVTRLAQLAMVEVEGVRPKPLTRKMFYDCNPPSKGHWTYKLFVAHKDPDTGEMLKDGDNYGFMQMNPDDNAANLPDGYIDTLKGLSKRLQKRFLLGEFSDETPNQLFTEGDIDKWRSSELPELLRVVVGVDPSGSGDVDNADNDEIGIVVAALGTDGNAYVLEDSTAKCGPKAWGRLAVSAYERHAADLIVAETNFGGAMVAHVIKTESPKVPFKAVTASRGKVIRAEPFSALYEAGKVRHAGTFMKLEDELTAFSTFGYTGQGSPNRADALIWALTELFPGIVNPRKPHKPVAQAQPLGWQG